MTPGGKKYGEIIDIRRKWCNTLNFRETLRLFSFPKRHFGQLRYTRRVVSNRYSQFCFNATHNQECCQTSNMFCWFNWELYQTVKILLTAITQSSPFVSVKKTLFHNHLCWGYISLRRSVFSANKSVYIWMVFLKADWCCNWFVGIIVLMNFTYSIYTFLTYHSLQNISSSDWSDVLYLKAKQETLNSNNRLLICDWLKNEDIHNNQSEADVFWSEWSHLFCPPEHHFSGVRLIPICKFFGVSKYTQPPETP